LSPGRRSCLTVALALALALLGAASALAAPDEPAREPFFPHAGDPGIDVGHYDVHLAYRPASGRLRATTTLAVLSTRRQQSFGLDLDGLTVQRVEVDGKAARFSRGKDKLVVHPQQPLAREQRFEAKVVYAGRPRKVVDPDGSAEGWYRTPDGALAVGEPQGTAAWIPCDNVPADKASFAISLTVPKGLAAVSNGVLASVEDGKGTTIYNWSEPSPMSTYLAVADIGRGEIERGHIAGKPFWTLVDPKLVKRSAKSLAQLPEIIHFESSIYGPYPFSSTGAIVDAAPQLGYALESQSRPIYAFAPDLTTVVHETAHQWFGDSVGLERWPNIWLNEGFATWTEWYYAERHGRRTAAEIFHKLDQVPASNTAFWNPPSGHPGRAKNLFSTATYVRGAMALEAYRLKVGTGPMLGTLRRWATLHRHASGDIEEFVALAEEVSGERVKPLFQRWLYERGKPS
jgi:aminopeptidase N